MARDELVELLARVRRSDSLDQLSALLPAIHQELIEIQRKRSHFLEDTCSVVLKQSFPSQRKWSESSESDSDPDEVEGGLTTKARTAIEICITFAEPLVLGLPKRAASEDREVTRERAVLVAFALSILGRPELTLGDDDDKVRQSISCKLAGLVLRSGIDFHTIMWTLRFREELGVFREMMIPGRTGSETEEGDSSDDDSGCEGEDDMWIARMVASSSGVVAPLRYFLNTSGQEYAFASWSAIGIVRLAGLVAVATSLLPFKPSALSFVSPQSNLFVMGAAAQALLQGQGVQVKRTGLMILNSALERCSPGEIAIPDPRKRASEGTALSFAETSSGSRECNWIVPLVELTSNAMVSTPNASDRALGLSVFRQLLQVVEIGNRFWLIRHLVLRCPYGNVAAILIDQLRSDTFRVWSAPNGKLTSTPYISRHITALILDLLKVLVDRDLKLHADFLASVASLIRFIAIRDEINLVGLRDEEVVVSVKDSLHRLQSRLHSTVGDTHTAPPSAYFSSSIHHRLHDGDARFVLVEAALVSTLALLRG